MFDLTTLMSFLGWSSIINISIFIVAAISLILFKNSISKLHGKMFGLDEAAVKMNYFNYLGSYKIAIVMLNVVPYLALRLMV